MPQAWLDAHSRSKAAGGRPGPTGCAATPGAGARRGQAGNAEFPVIEAAPGRYVKEHPRLNAAFRSQPFRRTRMTDIVIVAAQRTAVGKFGGALAKTPRPILAPMS
jgi:hypothetical protein